MGIPERSSVASIAALINVDVLDHESDAVDPRNSDWSSNDTADAIVLERRGRTDWKAVIGLAGIALFWNGIVSVFVFNLAVPGPDQPQGSQWWFMLLFLTPFLFIGSGILVVLGHQVLAPTRRSTLSITRHDVTFNLRGVARTRRWSVEVAEIASVHRRTTDNRAGEKSAANILNLSPEEGKNFEVALISASNAELAVVADLTYGDAGRLGTAIARERVV